MVEDKLPDQLKLRAYHPSAFVYAWKKNNLEKLIDELMASNIAITGGEVWLIEENKISLVIPLKNGEMKTFNWQTKKDSKEDWYDFVERSNKKTMEQISSWNLEKDVRLDLTRKIYYHLTLKEN